MRQYYTMHVDPTPEPAATTGSIPAMAPVLRSLVIETDTIIMSVMEDGHRPWTAESEVQVLRWSGVGWDTGIVSHTDLLTAFDKHYGGHGLAGSLAIEMSASEAIGAEEYARRVWDSIMQSQPLLIAGYSPK